MTQQPFSVRLGHRWRWFNLASPNLASSERVKIQPQPGTPDERQETALQVGGCSRAEKADKLLLELLAEAAKFIHT